MTILSLESLIARTRLDFPEAFAPNTAENTRAHMPSDSTTWLPWIREEPALMDIFLSSPNER